MPDNSTYYTKYFDGLGSTSAYQVAGQPYITGSNSLGAGHEHLIVFPFVTKTVTVQSIEGNSLRVHFNATGSANVVGGLHYAELNTNSTAGTGSLSLDIKCKELFVSNGGSDTVKYRVIAELTRIETNEMYPLTGSGISD